MTGIAGGKVRQRERVDLFSFRRLQSFLCQRSGKRIGLIVSPITKKLLNTTFPSALNLERDLEEGLSPSG
jgi:hypothetical protein